MRRTLIVLAAVLATPAAAESSLGIRGAALNMGAVEDEAGETRLRFGTSVDVAVTEAHGLQGDLSFEETGHGTIGRLTGHIYMDPNPGRKYGLFLSLSDVDGRSMTWGEFGAEGQYEVSEDLTVEGRAGLGRADAGGLDYIFGGIAMAYALSPAFDVEAALDLAEFDEADFRAVAVEARLRGTYRPPGQPWAVYAEIGRSDLTGRDGMAAATRIGAGLSVAFGNAGGVSTDTRMFRDHDPVANLIRRGAY